MQHLKVITELLDLESNSLKSMKKWMCHQRIISQQHEILQPMSVDQATKARDSLAKFMYSKLFDWIITKINATLSSPYAVQNTFGILDFCGFENLEDNHFEQFCINYGNEIIEQIFVQSVFKNIQEEYIREEIGWSFIKFRDNRQCIELLEGKGGILDTIDEALKVTHLYIFFLIHHIT